MSLTVQRIVQVIDRLAPRQLAEDWDNVGLQVGAYDKVVKNVLVTLTITDSLARRAAADGIDLIVAHHPLIFSPLKKIRTDTPGGRLLAGLLKNDVAVFVVHTNLDNASNGLNTWLAEDLGLQTSRVLDPRDESLEWGLGRIGTVQPTALEDLVQDVGRRWKTHVRFCGDPQKICRKIAVCGGSGGSLVSKAFAAGADVLITGDVSYHQSLEASQLGLAVIDAGHFGTEQIMITRVSQILREELADQSIALYQGQEGDNLWQQS